MVAHDPQRVRVVLREVVGDAGDTRVHLAAAELLRGDDLAGGGLHQRGPAEEDRALAADDDRLVAHGRDVGAAGRARAEHGRDLRDPGAGHPGLVVEDPPEVLAVGEHLVLHGQEGAAGVDQVDTGQAVLQRHLLGAQVLLHRHRVVRAALDGGVVGDDHALAPADPADPGDDAGGRGLSVVHPVGGEGGELQERRARVEQGVHPVAGQQLAARGVPGPRLLTAAQPGRGELAAQLLGERAVRLLVGPARPPTRGLPRSSAPVPLPSSRSPHASDRLLMSVNHFLQVNDR